MSSGRLIKCKINLELMERVCEMLGHEVRHDCIVKGHNGSTLAGTEQGVPLVIKFKGHEYEIGFDGTTAYADTYQGHVPAELEKILTKYYEEKISETRYEVEEVVETEEKIFLHVGRM